MDRPFQNDRVLRVPFRITIVLVGLMIAQSGLGLLFREAYRDAPWIKTAWFGNDIITLVLGVPLTIAAMLSARRGSLRGCLVWQGMLAYGVYNYAYYMLGVELNVFFPLYVAAFLAASAALILALIRLDIPGQVEYAGSPWLRLVVSGYFVTVAAGLTIAWIGMWAAYVMAGVELPVEASAFRLVAALDLALMVPVLATGGILLGQQRPWGIVIAGLAGVQSALYLLVLSTNSALAISKGIIEPPGEVPVWGTLCLLTVIATGTLFAKVRTRR